jgi:hypothetical protein
MNLALDFESKTKLGRTIPKPKWGAKKNITAS